MRAADPEVRRRMVHGAADMLRRRGLNATSVRELAKHSGTPLGSTYHYFPGGKRELAAEAVRYAGRTAAALLGTALESGPVGGIAAFLSYWRTALVSTEFQAGCPVLAVCIEQAPDPTTNPEDARDHALVLDTASEIFTQWHSLLAGSLEQHGVAPAAAARLATTVIAAVEGAIVLARAQRSIEPFDAVSEGLIALAHLSLSPGA